MLPIRIYYYSLVKRREKWAEQKKEEEKRKPDPDCPKGHKRVPEEERRKVLEKLKKCKFIVKNNFTQIVLIFVKRCLFTKSLIHIPYLLYIATVLYSLVCVSYSVRSLYDHKCLLWTSRLINFLQLKKNTKMNY